VNATSLASYPSVASIASPDAPGATRVRPEQLMDIQGLSVSFDGFKAVDDLSLTLGRNELRVIIGPNGAGKTTLLDMVCGKTRPSAGSIRFKGLELVGLPEYRIVRAGIGRKFQTPSVYEELTVAGNLEVSISDARGLWDLIAFRRTPEIRSRIRQVAAEVLLLDSLDRRAGQLSHGQKQWLEIGMLLLQESELLLLDEPVAGMSPRERELTAALLKRISVDKALIVIEHDMEFVRAIATTVTVLHQGRVLAEGSADEVQADPRVIEVYLGEGDSHA
jgi:urea transport system ATP-binding protein